MSSALATASKDWSIPIANIRKPELPPGRERRLEEDEEERPFAAADEARASTLGTGITLALETRMRRGEIALLTWTQIDLENRTMRRILRLLHEPLQDDFTPFQKPRRTAKAICPLSTDSPFHNIWTVNTEYNLRAVFFLPCSLYIVVLQIIICKSEIQNKVCMSDFTVRTAEQLPLLLQAFRKQAGLTQANVASRLGVTQQTLSSLERNAEKVNAGRLLALLSALGVEMVLRQSGAPHTPKPPSTAPDW